MLCSHHPLASAPLRHGRQDVSSRRSHHWRGWQVSEVSRPDLTLFDLRASTPLALQFILGVFPSFFTTFPCRKAVLTFPAPMPPIDRPRAATWSLQEEHGPYLVLSRPWLRSACQRKVFLLRRLALFPGPPAGGRTPGHTAPQKPRESAPTSPSRTSWIHGKVHP